MSKLKYLKTILIDRTKNINLHLFKFERKYLIILFLFSLISNLVLSCIGWKNKINDAYGFRQTQTAISTYYMIKDGISIKYITPVLGSPWSIPLEFPTYQIAVAIIVKIFHTPLDQTGRFISLLFFYLALIPLFLTLNLFIKNKNYCLLILSLVLLNPIYIFWSRTFMIESVALFFSIGFVYSGSKYLFSNKNRFLYLALVNIFGIAAGLTKITTFAVFAVFLIFIIIFNFFDDLKIEKRFFAILKKYIFFCFAIFTLSFASSVVWVQYSDFIKTQNPLANGFITSQALTYWNFGTTAQKLSFTVWNQIIDYSILIPKLTGINNIKDYFYLAIVLLLVVLLLGKKYKKWFFASLFLYFSGPLIFTNLYYIHSYYQYGSNIFLSLAIGFFCLSVLDDEKYKDRKIIIYLLIPIIFAVMLNGYYVKYYKYQKNGGENLDFTEIIKNNTNENGVVLSYGLDWSSEVPYYSERKTIAADAGTGKWLGLEDEKLKKSINNLGSLKVEALTINTKSPFFKTMDEGLIKSLISKFNLKKEPYDKNSNVLIYIKK